MSGEPPAGPAKISYAQNQEDVLLERVFRNVPSGFYIDIGAYHPIVGSVTKTFYDRGWRGINIEPGSIFECLAASRPRDINLKVAVADCEGDVELIENLDDPGVSRIKMPNEQAMACERGLKHRVQCTTLNTIVSRHAKDRLINFLKIDAEGSELSIISATDWKKIRPQVLVIEATAPWTNELVNDEWEPILLSNGFARAYFDGINVFYVRDEDAGFLRHFECPVNVLDHFVAYDGEKDAQANEIKETRLLNDRLVTKVHENANEIEQIRLLNDRLVARVQQDANEITRLRDQLRRVEAELERCPRILRKIAPQIDRALYYLRNPAPPPMSSPVASAGSPAIVDDQLAKSIEALLLTLATQARRN